jgi:hypothetical protein
LNVELDTPYVYITVTYYFGGWEGFDIMDYHSTTDFAGMRVTSANYRGNVEFFGSPSDRFSITCDPESGRIGASGRTRTTVEVSYRPFSISTWFDHTYVSEGLYRYEVYARGKWNGRWIPWKPIALALVLIVVASALAIVLVKYRPREEEKGWQPPVGWKLYRSETYIGLHGTEDNLPIENVMVIAPFPREFENLYLRNACAGGPSHCGLTGKVKS